MNNQKKDIHIIGCGLAGICTAWQFHFKNIPFTIYDNKINTSSRIAAGITNPIIFKRTTLGWKVNELLPYAQSFYESISKLTNHDFISYKNILYPFATIEDQNNWGSKMGDERFSPFIDFSEIKKIDGVINKHGFGLVKTFGSVDTNQFVDLSIDFFKKQRYIYRDHSFNYDNVQLNSNHEYIFCEGCDIEQNPFFNYIPMKPTHGETLILKCEGLNCDDIISKNLFILPLGNHQFKIGSTYNWELKESITTEEGKQDLIERFKQIINLSFEIISHEAGIRPTIHDRRPVLGRHPEHANLSILNGLGTKGVMLSPYFANKLMNHVLYNEELEREINVNRFESFRQ